jgi:branched-chain amino acid transport system permease protein
MTAVDRLRDSRTAVLSLGAVLAMLVLPFTGILSTFHLGLVISAMVLALFAMSFNLLFGYTGMLSFGHAAYFGTGAYTLALALDGQLGFLPSAFESFFPALLLAVVVAALVALVLGYLCVQRGDIYFAILTLALSMMLYETIYTWNDFTGGSDGITVLAEPIELGGLTLNLIDTGTFYYLTLAILVVSIVFIWRLINSPYGELLLSIRENPERATMIGVPVKRYQLSAFVIAGTFAGLAGTLFAVRTFIVTPHTLHWSMSAEPVMMTLLGGPSAFVGPIIGAVMFVGLEQFLSNVTEYWQFGLGLLIVPIVLFFPDGLVGILRGDSGGIVDVRDYLSGLVGDEPTGKEDTHE